MQINISINVDALGHESGWGKCIPMDEFPEGEWVRINRCLPDQYQQYVKPIGLMVSGNMLYIESEYVTGTKEMIPWLTLFNTGKIGLSYATCDISIGVVNLSNI